MNKVAVFGSLNMDIIVEVDDFPKPGQTIKAKSIDYKAGGKGINQAAAAAAVGASTILIGTVGQDTFGQQLIAQIDKIPNLDGSLIRNAQDEPTGIASILSVGDDNMIAIISGANNLTDRKRAEEVRGILTEADVLIVQFETPMDGIKEALKEASKANTVTVVNPAPYENFDHDLLQFINVITPNETEFKAMAKDFDLVEGSLENQMLEWQKKYPEVGLIVTRGKDGLSYIEGGSIVTLQPIKVNPVDTTGAGDTFSGVLGGLLAKGLPVEEAIYKAAVAAGLSVAHKGALGSAPKMEEIDLYLSKAEEGADNSNY